MNSTSWDGANIKNIIIKLRRSFRTDKAKRKLRHFHIILVGGFYDFSAIKKVSEKPFNPICKCFDGD